MRLLALISLLALSCKDAPTDDGSATGGAGDEGSDNGGDDGGDEGGDEGDGDDTADDTGDPVATVSLALSLGCSDEVDCTGDIAIVLRGPSGRALSSTIVVGDGEHIIEVPQDLGVAGLTAFADDDGDADEDPGEARAVNMDPLEVGTEDLGTDEPYTLTLHPHEPFDPGFGLDLGDGRFVLPEVLLLFMDEGSTQAEAEAVASAVGGTLGDEMEGLDGWDLTLPEDLDAEAMLALEAQLLDTEGVEDVVLNVLIDGLRGRTITVDDYTTLTGDQGKAFKFLRVNEAKDIYDGCTHHFAPDKRDRTVTIAIVDGALQAVGAEEFAGYSFVSEHHKHSGAEPDMVGYHGSFTTGLIQGRQNGRYHNGMLEGFVGSVDSGGTYSILSTALLHNVGHGGLDGKQAVASRDLLWGVYYAGAGEAQVVNLSIGEHLGSTSKTEEFWKHLDDFSDILGKFSPKTFVIAAGNKGANLDGIADWASLSLRHENLLVVGGLNMDTRGLDPQSNYSDRNRVHVLAPSLEVWTYATDWNHNKEGDDTVGASAMTQGSGTSFAAPMVTAAVAFQKAFDPDMSNADHRLLLSTTGDDTTDSRVGRSLGFQRVVVERLGEEIDPTVSYLLTYTTSWNMAASTCISPLSLPFKHSCVPIAGTTTYAGISDVKDVYSQTYSLSGSASGSPTLTWTISGAGAGPQGMGDHNTVFTGTVSADPQGEHAGDLYVTGTFTGTAAACSGGYAGSFTARLYPTATF